MLHDQAGVVRMLDVLVDGLRVWEGAARSAPVCILHEVCNLLGTIVIARAARHRVALFKADRASVFVGLPAAR